MFAWIYFRKYQEKIKKIIKDQLLFGLFIFPKYLQAELIMGFTKPCSHPFSLTPTYSHQLPPTSIYLHSLLPITTQSHTFPSTPTHSHSHPRPPIFYLLALIFSHFTHSHLCLSHFYQFNTHPRLCATSLIHFQQISKYSHPIQPVTYHSNPYLVPVFYMPTPILMSIYFFFCFEFCFENNLSLQA